MMTEADAETVELDAMQAAWRALCSDWQLSDREVQELLSDGLANARSATETRMRLLLEINHRLPYSIAELSDWLRLATPQFGWLSPLEAMSTGLSELRQVRRVVEKRARS